MSLCLFVPGFWLARRLFTDPADVIGAAIGFSGIFCYVFGWFIYLSGLPWDASYAITALAVIIAILECKRLRDLLAGPQAKTLLIAQITLILWLILLLLVI